MQQLTLTEQREVAWLDVPAARIEGPGEALVRPIAVAVCDLDQPIVPFQISCGDCERCRAGLTGNCTSVPPRSMYGFGMLGGDWGGALSDVLRVPFADAMLVPLPAGVEPAHAASLCDNVADGWRTVAPQLEWSPGAAVLIVGEPETKLIVTR